MKQGETGKNKEYSNETSMAIELVKGETHN